MIETDDIPVKIAKGLKHKAEEEIQMILDRFEKDTGCMVCDVGFWHWSGGKGIEKVELRVTL